MVQDMRVVDLLIRQSTRAGVAGRYTEALAAATRAVEAADRLDDPGLLVRALGTEGSAFRMLGDNTSALIRFTRVLGLAEDPATRSRLTHPTTVLEVASAYWSWVESARFLTGIPVRKLSEVLDTTDRWLEATGHREWRDAVLYERAVIHSRLGEHDAAVACAKEALALALRNPSDGGWPLYSYRCKLGDVLCSAGYASEAASHYQDVIDDPSSSPWGRYSAHRGLADCALAAGDPISARREAERAVQFAEPLGDDDRCDALDRLGRACRAQGDLAAAWHAAKRHLETAARIGDHYFPYYATRNAADIALDQADEVSARRFLDDLDVHARAMDTAAETTIHTADVARIRRRFANGAPEPQTRI